MSRFTSSCPFCQSELELDSNWLGMEVECPECKKSFKVTAPDKNIPKIQSVPFLEKSNTLPPPPLPPGNSQFAPPPAMPSGNSQFAPSPLMPMDNTAAAEYLFLRRKKNINIIAVVLVILSIICAAVSVVTYFTDIDGVGDGECYGVGLPKSQASSRDYYSREVTVGSSSYQTAVNTYYMANGLERGIDRYGEAGAAMRMFGNCSVIFMLLAIFLKLHLIFMALARKL
ncbi:MAG: hypothetical protein E7058_06650 [Lentisphaerae bacterium]|nr:hypothetical protein [Lentisphaerota bacterium]